MTTTLRVVVDLRSSAIAGRDATRMVRQMLIEAGAYSLLHDASLAVTEVAGVVTRITGPCQLDATYDDERRRLRVEVTARPAEDGRTSSTESPLALSSFPFVAALATERGITPSADGTTVWFEMLQFCVADVPV